MSRICCWCALILRGEDFLGETHFAKAEGNGIVRDKSGNFGVIGTSYARDKGDIFFMYATPIWTTIKFFKNLFWDIDETELDVAENRRFIIERVLTRGRMSDWWVLIHLYSFDVIKTEVVQIRYLDKLTLNFCSTFFHLPKTAFRCYNQPQSIQQFWQY